MTNPRNPAGTPTGGQFSALRRAEVHLSAPLSAEQAEETFRPGDRKVDLTAVWDTESYESLEQAAHAGSSEELDELIGHPNCYVRAEVASNLHLSVDQAWKLADDPDWGVRWQVARRHVSGLSEHLANDEDEVVRAECLGDRTLAAATRERLLADPEVTTVLTRLTGSDQF